MKILIADDNIDIAEMLKEVLCREGHSVSLVFDGRSLLTEITHKSFDLIISDDNMPEMNGLQAVKQSKTKTPVIFISAGKKEDFLGRLLLKKPFSMKEIVGLVNEIMKLKLS